MQSTESPQRGIEKQVGQSVEYMIADRLLILNPLPLGRIKKATLILIQKSDDNIETIAKYILAILDNGHNAGLTLEWIQDNITLPKANEIIDDSRVINGLGSFFQKGTPEKAAEIKTERPLEEQVPPTPSA